MSSYAHIEKSAPAVDVPESAQAFVRPMAILLLFNTDKLIERNEPAREEGLLEIIGSVAVPEPVSCVIVAVPLESIEPTSASAESVIYIFRTPAASPSLIVVSRDSIFNVDNTEPMFNVLVPAVPILIF